MSAQDDARENEMRTLFNLTRPDDFKRADIDAVLVLKGAAVPKRLQGERISFELKSATTARRTISTVRDFGLHYLEKWRELHWLFGIYDGDKLDYCMYGSPQAMKPWFDDKAAYIGPDVALAKCLPALMTDDTLTEVFGDGQKFDRTDAKRLMKNQYRAADYADAADLPGGEYSRAAMLKLLRRRARYVIDRGATLNNPHIPASYFAGWEQITEDHAARLRELVVEALS